MCIEFQSGLQWSPNKRQRISSLGRCDIWNLYVYVWYLGYNSIRHWFQINDKLVCLERRNRKCLTNSMTNLMIELVFLVFCLVDLKSFMFFTGLYFATFLDDVIKYVNRFYLKRQAIVTLSASWKVCIAKLFWSMSICCYSSYF